MINNGTIGRPIPIFLVCMLVTALVPGCIQEPEDEREFVEYRVFITADGPFAIALPIPDCDPVSDRLRVTDGKGEFHLTETSYGTCFNVSGDSRIEIKGRWFPETSGERSLMTVNLSTMEKNVTMPYVWGPYCLSIPNRNIWIQWIDGANVEVSLNSKMLFRDLTYSFHYSPSFGPLELGWNEVATRGFAGEVNVD